MLFFSKRWFYWFVRQYRHVTVTVMTSDNGILAQQAQKSNVVTRLGCGGGWNSRPYMLPWAAGVPYRVVCLLWIIHHISAHHREVTGYCLYQWASRSPRRRTPLKGFHSFHCSKVRWHCDRQCENYLSSYQQAYLRDEDADKHSFCSSLEVTVEWIIFIMLLPAEALWFADQIDMDHMRLSPHARFVEHFTKPPFFARDDECQAFMA